MNILTAMCKDIPLHEHIYYTIVISKEQVYVWSNNSIYTYIHIHILTYSDCNKVLISYYVDYSTYYISIIL